MSDGDEEQENDLTRLIPRVGPRIELPLAAIARGCKPVPRVEFESPTELDGLTIVAEIGRGATSRVYLGHDDAGGKQAVKLFWPRPGDGLLLHRFEREMAALERIDHPNVTRKFGDGQFGGQPYYRLEWAELGDFRRFAWPDRQLRGVIAPALAIRWVAQACRGLHAIHLAGYVHRDFKPDNALLLGDGRVAVCDLGLVLPADELDEPTITRARERMGTAGYMAPEQLIVGGRTEQAAHTDVFALGVVLGELVTGVGPVWKQGWAMPAIPSVPGPLGAIIAKATAKEVSSRYSTAAEMAEALEQLA